MVCSIHSSFNNEFSFRTINHSCGWTVHLSIEEPATMKWSERSQECENFEPLSLGFHESLYLINRLTLASRELISGPYTVKSKRPSVRLSPSCLHSTRRRKSCTRNSARSTASPASGEIKDEMRKGLLNIGKARECFSAVSESAAVGNRIPGSLESFLDLMNARKSEAARRMCTNIAVLRKFYRVRLL